MRPVTRGKVEKRISLNGVSKSHHRTSKTDFNQKRRKTCEIPENKQIKGKAHQSLKGPPVAASLIIPLWVIVGQKLMLQAFSWSHL